MATVMHAIASLALLLLLVTTSEGQNLINRIQHRHLELDSPKVIHKTQATASDTNYTLLNADITSPPHHPHDIRVNITVYEIYSDDRPRWKIILDLMTTIILTANTVNLMLGMGAATYWKDIVYHAWPPTGVLIGMVCQFVLLPAVMAILTWMLGFSHLQSMGVLMVASSPGGSFSNFACYLCDGDIALSIIMTTISSAVAFGMMPFNLWLYSKLWQSNGDGQEFMMPYVTITAALICITIPAVIGMLIRHFNERAASVVTKFASIVGFMSVCVTCTLAGIVYWHVIVTASILMYFTAILLPLLGFCLAYVISLMMCRSHKVCRTIGIETGCQNMGVALSVILLSFHDPRVKNVVLVFPLLYSVMVMAELTFGVGAFQAHKRICDRQNKKLKPSRVERAIPEEREGLQRSITT